MLRDAPPRLVGVDYGTRRVGVALADPLRLAAQPHGIYAPDEAVEVLRRMQEQEGIERLVVGLPLTREGGEDVQTDRARQYANRLRNALGVEVVLWDERSTTEDARTFLHETGRRPKHLDAAAAAVLLQDYLDAQDETAA